MKVTFEILATLIANSFYPSLILISAQHRADDQPTLSLWDLFPMDTEPDKITTTTESGSRPRTSIIVFHNHDGGGWHLFETINGSPVVTKDDQRIPLPFGNSDFDVFPVDGQLLAFEHNSKRTATFTSDERQWTPISDRIEPRHGRGIYTYIPNQQLLIACGCRNPGVRVLFNIFPDCARTCELKQMNEDTWTSRTLPKDMCLRWHATQTYKNNMYITGGANCDEIGNNDMPTKRFMQYDYENDEWKSGELEDMNHDRLGHEMVQYRGGFVVCGGTTFLGPITSCERYNVRKNEWTELEKFPSEALNFLFALSDTQLLSFDNRLYIHVFDGEKWHFVTKDMCFCDKKYIAPITVQASMVPPGLL